MAVSGRALRPRGGHRVSQQKPYVLALNGGSSSIKFTLYRACEPPERRVHGKIDRIGARGTALTFDDADRGQRETRVIGDFDHQAAAGFLIDWLDQRIDFGSIGAVGHRVVNGGANYNEPQCITDELLAELRRISGYAPEHLPAQIAIIELCRARVPQLPQVACFDTAFHRDMPRVAKILPIPRRLQAQGVARYGFHGLSYSYLMETLARVAGADAAQGRVILAHLGNGASLAAVRGGKGIDTSMGFTPTAGVPMGTRSGDLDPGLVWYLAYTEQMTPEAFQRMVNHESGLLGVSETSSDLRDLLVREAEDVRAFEAVALFCYQVKKCIGAFAAALGGLDTLVFTGGIGENAPVIRARICADLEFLGIRVDGPRNESSAPLISADTAGVQVRVIATDEEIMIAQAVGRLVQHT